MKRQSIVTVVGHVDHGKSSILDYIRGSSVVKREAGAITQAIGASIVPLRMIQKICGPLLDTIKKEILVPGILFIDTPGHAAFTTIRKRGGNLADIAVLVIDINEGVMPQTIECIDILKSYKTPFVVAANKIDQISGWQKASGSALQRIAKQHESVQKRLDEKLYTIVGKLSEYGFESERFDRVLDYTKQIAIIPTSASTGAGIPELLMVLMGLGGRFLESQLTVSEGKCQGTILEVKEEKGLGATVDAIIYDGTLKKNDIIVVGSAEGAFATKVKGLFEPAPLSEMRDKKSKFKPVQEVRAATGVKILAVGIEKSLAGAPLRGCGEGEVEKVKEEVQREVEEVLIQTDQQGIILKADSLGSLEALAKLLKEKSVPVRKASVGMISKSDIADAESNLDPLTAVILGFNVPAAASDKVKIITHDVIYRLLEDYEKWKASMHKEGEQRELEGITKPCKIQLMKGYVFRHSNPAVVGVDILAGTLATDTPLMKADGKEFTRAKGIQADQENIPTADRGKQVAVSLSGVVVGRQIQEGEVLYSSITEDEFRKLKQLKKYLSKDQIDVLKEIATIMRKENPVWGV